MNFRFQNNFWSSCNHNQTIDTVIFKNVLNKIHKVLHSYVVPIIVLKQLLQIRSPSYCEFNEDITNIIELDRFGLLELIA